jgi:hypothetical protein
MTRYIINEQHVINNNESRFTSRCDTFVAGNKDDIDAKLLNETPSFEKLPSNYGNVAAT